MKISSFSLRTLEPRMALPAELDGNGSTDAPAINQHDLTAPRNEWLYKPPAWLERRWSPLLKDARDRPMIYLMFNVLTLTVPSAFLLFILLPSHLLGLVYFGLNTALLVQRFVLWLHFCSHRPTYRTDVFMGRVLNFLPANIIGPFFGVPTGMYKLHHLVIHHAENNVYPHDVSSTEPYQRDNPLHFLHYWLRFLFAAIVELPYYAYRKGRMDVCRNAVLSSLAWMAMLYLTAQVNAVATFWAFGLPFLFCSAALMFGNWSQHIFINPDTPRSNYSLTINCINTPNNQKTFNDGYHILHHLNSRMHWSELPDRFRQPDVLEQHRQEDAIVVDGLWFDQVGALCMLGRLDLVADRVVQFGKHRRSKSELIAELKRRLTPISTKKQA